MIYVMLKMNNIHDSVTFHQLKYFDNFLENYYFVHNSN